MNIYDVAKLSGVSIATASKALNGRKDVREETRQRIVDIAKKLNYHPSHMARGLAKRCSENIGVVALRRFQSPFFTNPFYSRVMEGMEIEVTRENYNLLLTVIPVEEVGANMAYPKMVREKNVDGLCLVGEVPESFLAEISSRGIPAVVVDYYSSQVPGHYVVPDNAGGVRLGVEHLLNLGHRKLAFVGGGEQNFSFGERKSAFEKELAKAGLKAQPGLDFDMHAPGPYDALAAYLKRPDLPTALVCCNDEYALIVLTLAQKLGLKVPHDLSVLGFDDINAASAAIPALTTLHVEKQEMGAKAIHIVLDLIAHPEARPKRVETPVHLIVRASTAKPAR